MSSAIPISIRPVDCTTNGNALCKPSHHGFWPCRLPITGQQPEEDEQAENLHEDEKVGKDMDAPAVIAATHPGEPHPGWPLRIVGDLHIERDLFPEKCLEQLGG